MASYTPVSYGMTGNSVSSAAVINFGRQYHAQGTANTEAFTRRCQDQSNQI